MISKTAANIAVLGGGTWGVALARMLSGTGHKVTVWSNNPEHVEQLDRTRTHFNLPGSVIPEGVLFEKNIAAACIGRDMLVMAVPSPFVRETAARIRDFVTADQIIVDAAKGLEPLTYYTMTEVIRDELEKRSSLKGIRIAALSGPSHAEEVVKDLPTCLVSACEDPDTADLVRDTFISPFMRVYSSTDVRGVELCAALKNIVAIAAGISAGLGFGDNAKAAIITRGTAEIAKLGKADGCNEMTFFGLAGIGDIIVTATSMHSRNCRCGLYIGQGMTPKEAVEKVGMVVEGVNAIPAAMQLARKYRTETHIIAAVNAIVNLGIDPRVMAQRLLNLSARPEF